MSGGIGRVGSYGYSITELVMWGSSHGSYEEHDLCKNFVVAESAENRCGDCGVYDRFLIWVKGIGRVGSWSLPQLPQIQTTDIF